MTTDEETLRLLTESLDADVLTDATTDAEVDQELRDAGGDPAAIVAWGRAVIDQLLARRRAADIEDRPPGCLAVSGKSNLALFAESLDAGPINLAMSDAAVDAEVLRQLRERRGSPIAEPLRIPGARFDAAVVSCARMSSDAHDIRLQIADRFNEGAPVDAAEVRAAAEHVDSMCRVLMEYLRDAQQAAARFAPEAP